MGIPQVDTFNKIGLCIPKAHSKKSDIDPPAIPPRMTAKGPELPEKPPHLRLASLTTKTSNVMHNNVSISRQVSSQQLTHQNNNRNKTNESHTAAHGWNQTSNNQKLFMDIVRKKTASTNKEILVAATKGSRERPAEKRQREPAKLLMPISNSSENEDSVDHNESLPVLLGLTSPKPRRKPNQPAPNITTNKKESIKPVNLGSNSQKLSKPRAPVLLIPRSQLDTRNLHQIWNAYPMSYSVWVHNSGNGDPQMTSRLFRRSLSPNSLIIRHGHHDKQTKNSIVKSKDFPIEAKIFNFKKSPLTSGTSVKPRSSSVTRSGSLTSHGSTSSESGNETFPKSVLKKHKKDSCSSSSECSKKTNEHKKNVTFNAFATVQLMDE